MDYEKRMKAGETVQTVTYDMAQSEIAESTGLMDLARQGGGGGAKTKGDLFFKNIF